ncbi:proline--tRNA ligase [Candidatus Nitrososphaera gargensis Ga9.2]|uniref:Proline--tRNA ligase n=1 Tax=Nitrososphaera gargensis (strain Ga9.2) TaxID=1237085 RepID=K0IN69_NITGG|nr:proline--tRNA ligase [Candidatus Nitrososphaera gargensis Ga9.2]
MSSGVSSQPRGEAAGITVKKSEDFSEWYTQVVLKAGLADYAPVKGFIVLRPYGYAIWESIRDILDRRFKETGHQNGFLPVLIPESLLSKEEDHFAGFTPEVFWVTKAGDNNIGEKLALRPTSETLAYSVFAKWITSYRDLPLKINFWNTALRAEIKATKPFIRTSEFLWQEGHTVHATEEEAEQEVMTILGIYKDMIENYLAVPVITGYKSDTEKFVGAKYTTTLEGLMADGKALQMGTSHHLAQNFSKPFEIKYLGKDTKEHFAWQTSWGVSWRLIGALIMVHGDDKGLVLPPQIAPIQVVIVPIHKDKDAKLVKDKAAEIELELKHAGIRAYMDSRDEYTSGWKFNEWEMKGVPLRINLGPRDIEKGQVEFVRRDTKDKKQDDRTKLVDTANSLLVEIQKNLLSKARAFLQENISRPASYDEFKSIIENKGGFVMVGWCGQEECEEKIKQDTGADIRVLPFDQKDRPGKCIYCGQDSKKAAIFARAY